MYHILLIENNEIERSSISNNLTKKVSCDLSFTLVNHNVNNVGLIDENKLDLVVLNLNMPNVMGYEEIKTFKADDDTPIIAYSGALGEVEPDSFLKIAELLGADFVLPSEKLEKELPLLVESILF
ncbi:response regulator [Pseudoalteromonas denitrificans]|jgi:putative two-component system response regulator|uniref:Response regulator receiver domain-containing protein n=1 Tax=Pseudoalteromonas denitrificans DSM 6059 TaxID=1123010 RepID=A0A1I1MY15_9GAMM|nr:response regulator [Pseudoalteromonas denitrificans]SFC90287.1 Response regulator receiver domain-containing protein [Pseudoalteromonas denitrificans DSM 6059]